ncbi:MAG: GatB/YqeY domain-containing protein [Verrucomicrobiota bacterium]
MSSLNDRIQQEMKEAMKAKDTLRLTVIRALKAAVTNAAIEKGGLGTELEDSEIVAVIRKQLKQRQDSAEQFTSAGRDELAAKENSEIEILQAYLPAQLSGDEIVAIVEAAVSETGASSKADMGKVMKLVQEKAAGRADGKTLSQEVAKRLA